MDEEEIKTNEEEVNSSVSNNDDDDEYEYRPVVQFDDLIKNTVLYSDYDLDDVKDRIRDQFSNYISTSDRTNYLNIMFRNFRYSRMVINQELDEYTPERSIALRNMYDEFIEFLEDIIESKLTISIVNYDTSLLNDEDIEFIYMTIYEFFILEARQNFKTVISNDIRKQIKGYTDEEDYFNKAQELILYYSPMITTITCEDFLLTLKRDDIKQLYDMGVIAGNFFRKYSPKFYKNDEFLVEVLNQVMTMFNFKIDMNNFLHERTN